MSNQKWLRYQLSQICELNPGKKELQDFDRETEVSFLPMACVSEEGKILNQEKRKLKDVIKGFTYFKEEDVLLAKITPCFENGKRAIAKNLLNGIGFGSTEFHVLRPNGNATSRWIFYAVSQDDFRNIAKSQMTGTAGQKRVPKRVLEQYEIPIPEISEQEIISEKIETQFTRLDAAIKSLKTIKNKLEIYRQSVLKAVFEGKLVEADFEDMSIEDSSTSVMYGTSQKAKIDGSIPVLRMGNLSRGKIDYSNLKFYGSLKGLEDFKLIKGDILFNRTNSSELVGKTSIFQDDCDYRDVVFASYLIRIRVDSTRIIPAYLNYWLNSPQSATIKRELQSQQVGQANINGTKLKNIQFPFVNDLSIQTKIVAEIESRFSVIDKVEEVVDNALLKADRLRKSILKAAFQGKFC